MEENYTNEKLARDYLSVVTQYCQDFKGEIGRMKKISGAEIDIESFYFMGEGLSDLKINYLGSKTKRVLELLLTRGLEKTKEIIADEKEEEMRRQVLTMKGGSKESNVERPDAFLENAVRILEGD